MAESLVQVTEGAGKKLHTFSRVIGANTVEDEIVLLGHPYEAEYFIDPGALAVLATANSHLIQIMAGASLNLYIHRIVGYLSALPAATTNMQFQVRRLSTAGTGGTAGAIAQLDPGDAAAGATTQTLPTVKGTEGGFVADAMGIVPNALPTTMFQPIVFDFDWRAAHLKPLRITAGTANGVCVKNNTALATASLLVVASFSEANF